MHILQISDTHLFKDKTEELLGCCTQKSFDQTISLIKQEALPFDCILLTGDLSHDGSPESYQYLAERLSEFNVPAYWLPGNHDVLSFMEVTLNKTQVMPQKELHFKDWSYILLDSLEEGKVPGFLNQNELTRLEKFLTQCQSNHILVSLHHHPIPLGCGWLDSVGLRNASEFNRLLKISNKVRLVLFGHVHQEFDQVINNIRFIGSPSTSIQFHPKTPEFAVDHQPPGCRFVELKADGTINTVVKRIQNYDMKVNYTATGY